MFAKKWLVLTTLTMILALVAGACASPTPTAAPTQPPAAPTAAPTQAPAPTAAPTQPPAAPTAAPTQPPAPTAAPTQPPAAPTAAPTKAPAAPEDYSQAARKDTLILDIYATVDNPDLWNPFVPGVYNIQGRNQSMMEPFMMLNLETGELQGWLAESFTPNATNDVWTMKLRKGVTWSDGVPMTADDVVFTIQMIMAHKELRYNAVLTAAVKEVKKIDELTTEFTLTKPSPRFAFDNFVVTVSKAISPMPKHIWDGQDPLTFKNYDKAKGWPVFSGPYKLYSISPTDFVYVRDDNWWGYKTGFQPLPAPKKLVWTYSANDDLKVALMSENGMDVMHDITFGAYQTLQAKNPKVEVWHDGPPYSWPDPCARTLALNNAVAPWNDKDMRWALNYAINRDQIIDIAYENTSSKLDGIFPSYKPLNDLMAKLPPELVQKMWTYDTKKAADILTSKGYTQKGAYWQKDGKNLSLSIYSIQGDSESNRMVDIIVEQLQSFGIDAVDKIQDDGTRIDNVELGKYEATFSDWTCNSVGDPWPSMDTLAGTKVVPIGTRATGNEGNGNLFRYANKDYTDIVNQMGTLPIGDPKVSDLFVKGMTIFYDDLPVIPIAQAKKLLPYNTTYWTNFPTANNAYVQPAHWWQTCLLILTHIKPAQ